MNNTDYFSAVIEFKKRSEESLHLLRKLIVHNVKMQKYELAALQRDIEKKLQKSYREFVDLEKGDGI